MAMTVKNTTSFEPELGEYASLQKSESLMEWLSHLPDGAELSAIIHDLGSQRDPIPTLVGLRATWEIR